MQAHKLFETEATIIQEYMLETIVLSLIILRSSDLMTGNGTGMCGPLAEEKDAMAFLNKNGVIGNLELLGVRRA